MSTLYIGEERFEAQRILPSYHSDAFPQGLGWHLEPHASSFDAADFLIRSHEEIISAAHEAACLVIAAPSGPFPPIPLSSRFYHDRLESGCDGVGELFFHFDVGVEAFALRRDPESADLPRPPTIITPLDEVIAAIFCEQDYLKRNFDRRHLWATDIVNRFDAAVASFGAGEGKNVFELMELVSQLSKITDGFLQRICAVLNRRGALYSHDWSTRRPTTVVVASCMPQDGDLCSRTMHGRSAFKAHAATLERLSYSVA